MKHLSIICALFFAACEFNPGGLPADDDADAGADTDAAPDTDADVGSDAGAEADAAPDAAPPSGPATIVCSAETIGGLPKIVLTFGGDFSTGFLGEAPAAAPVAIEYGSNVEDADLAAACPNKWAVPYQAGCTKPSAAWSAAPRLILEPETDFLNVAIRYADGTVRWGDLKTSDDPVGFEVSGADCYVMLVDGGAGGYFRTHP
ncbi:MAG TPA: hypothetical protein VL283_04485 [Candidatus Baltobacteraceae bacterium]|nr:hypothetical protein [Candidatus Baltobacteraceae bacterium]